jgi:dihydrofolate reductase
MGTLIVSTNTTLDGVTQDPDGSEGSSHGSWWADVSDADRAAWVETETDEVKRADALLIGRRSYDFFASRWATRTGEFADRMNAIPKFVVSATITNPGWNNSRLLSGTLPDGVTSLKNAFRGEILVYGSATLARSLFEHRLVDELRIIIFPSVVGDGARLFEPGGPALPLSLIDHHRIGDNLAYVSHRITRPGSRDAATLESPTSGP